MPPTLSSGAIMRMRNNDTNHTPTLQLIDIKRIHPVDAVRNHQADRYRLIISDGTHMMQAMSATQLNPMFEHGRVTLHDIVRLDEFLCNTVQNRRIIIMLSFTLLTPHNEQIGNPARVEDQEPAMLTVPEVLAAHGAPLARELLKLSEQPSNAPGLLEANAHYILAGLLRGGPHEAGTFMACAALLLLVSCGAVASAAVAAAVRQAGAVAPAVALLRAAPEGEIEVRPGAHLITFGRTAVVISLLASLMEDSDEGRDAAYAEGALPLLVRQLPASGECAGLAARALTYLARAHPGHGAEICEAGAIPSLVAMVHASGEPSEATPDHVAVALLQLLASQHVGAGRNMWVPLAIRDAGGIPPLVAFLQRAQAAETGSAESAGQAAALLLAMAKDAPPLHAALLYALAARPPRSFSFSDATLVDLFVCLQPLAKQELEAAERGDDADAVDQAVRQAAAVRLPGVWLARANARGAALREAAEEARRARRAALGLDGLETPAEFICPIECDVMKDPVVASDGHTYERAAIEQVLGWEEERRKSPMTRDPLKNVLFPNIALRQRIAAHEADAEKLAERVARRAVEAERASVAASAAAASAAAAAAAASAAPAASDAVFSFATEQEAVAWVPAPAARRSKRRRGAA